MYKYQPKSPEKWPSLFNNKTNHKKKKKKKKISKLYQII